MIRFIIIALLIFAPMRVSAQKSSVYPVLPQKKQLTSFSLNSPVNSRKTSNQSFRVLAIRVEFKEDNNPLTSGSGKFDYSTDTGDTVDSPPHNRRYFLDHIEALKRYYTRVSNGKVDITYDLFPAGEQAAYTLPEEMAYYNPITTEEQLDMRLSELLRDAVESADADPAVDFSLYNTIIIFHAGVGADFALEDPALNPTPHDLPSVYLDLKHLRRTIGNNIEDYPGIPVDGGEYVTSAVILPETESKRGVQIGLNGIAAHQFGHYLGLPPLFNTASGRSAIGKWGLMCVGFANLNGVVPAEPCAWSKVFLEWEVPVEVQNGTNLTVVPSKAANGTKIYKIPITPTEYFLIENRQQDFTGDGLNLTKSTSGVVLEADDYDVDIPGSGLLIWHIDERIIAAGLRNYSVNAEPYMRGVDLEEADGSQDIGESFPGLIPGMLSPENGLEWDAFYAGNNTEFTPVTAPGSMSNSRGNSHIYINNISEKSNSMTFSVKREWYVEDFPLFLGGDFSLIIDMAPMWLDPFAPDSIKLIVPSINGSIFALNGRNEPFIDNGSMSVIYDSFGDSSIVGVPLFIEVEHPLASVPALTQSSLSPGDLYRRLVIATYEPKIKVYSLNDADGDLFGDLVNEWDLPAWVTSPVMISDWIITGVDDGTARFYNSDGSLAHAAAGSGNIIGLTGIQDAVNPLTVFLSSNGGFGYISGTTLVSTGDIGFTVLLVPLFSDIDADATEEFVVIGLHGELFINEEPPVVNNFEVIFHFSPVAGDINGDGFREIIVVSGSKIYAITHSGVFVSGFHIDIRTQGYRGIITTEPILGDITGDGKQNILFGTSEGNVMAIDDNGRMVQGFPLPLGSSAIGSLTLLKNALSDRLELAALDIAGYLYVWDLETTFNDKTIAWGTYGGGNAHLRHNVESLTTVAHPPANRLMPADRVYNWPNPNDGNWTNIRYYLYHEAEVKIRIFTQVGELVAELKGPGVAQTDNEVRWDLTGIESGIYLAEVTATGSRLTEKKIIKIAVIKE